MDYIDSSLLQQLHLPAKDSHKGDNGKLLIVGGSKLFHGSSLWALKTASRIVDMVYYASVEENQELTKHLKKQLYAFINVPLGKEADYAKQADAILIGPGMVRGNVDYAGTGETGQQTKEKTVSLFKQFPLKQWVIDAGSLQMIEVADLRLLKMPIITPHRGEFERLFEVSISDDNFEQTIDIVATEAKENNLIIVLKGPTDIIASPDRVILNKTGNEGMTKGGTGDVLAGLIGALACKNDPFIAAAAGAYINGLAGDVLYKRVGPFFNADDLADIVPYVLWEELGSVNNN